MEANELAAVLGEIRGDNEAERRAKAAEKKTEATEKKRRKDAAEAQSNQRKANLLPSLKAFADRLAEDEATISSLNVETLRNLLKYFYEPQISGISSLKRPDLVESVLQKVEEYRNRAEV